MQENSEPFAYTNTEAVRMFFEKGNFSPLDNKQLNTDLRAL